MWKPRISSIAAPAIAVAVLISAVGAQPTVTVYNNFGPERDGWDYNFQVNYGRQLGWFIEGCIEINKAVREAGLIFGEDQTCIPAWSSI